MRSVVVEVDVHSTTAVVVAVAVVVGPDPPREADSQPCDPDQGSDDEQRGYPPPVPDHEPGEEHRAGDDRQERQDDDAGEILHLGASLP